MSMGLPDDPRKFQPPYERVITKDVSTKVHKQKRCCYCGLIIEGKIWRVDSKHVECTRCHNE